jgi:hypothetical protein
MLAIRATWPGSAREKIAWARPKRASSRKALTSGTRCPDQLDLGLDRTGVVDRRRIR